MRRVIQVALSYRQKSNRLPLGSSRDVQRGHAWMWCGYAIQTCFGTSFLFALSPWGIEHKAMRHRQFDGGRVTALPFWWSICCFVRPCPFSSAGLFLSLLLFTILANFEPWAGPLEPNMICGLSQRLWPVQKRYLDSPISDQCEKIYTQFQTKLS